MFTVESGTKFLQHLFSKLLFEPSYHNEVLQDLTTLKENLILWHNLEENPNDVPKHGNDVVAKMHNGFRDCITHYNPETGYWYNGTPIAWFEYPEFVREGINNGN